MRSAMIEPREQLSSPLDRAWVDLYHEVHSSDAILAGVDFAAVLPEKPRHLPPAPKHKPLSLRWAAFRWPRSRRLHLLPVDEVVKHGDELMAGLEPGHVVLATPQLPEPLWRLLKERGYERRVDERQHEGWLEESEGEARWLLDNRPELEGSIGLLPQPGDSALRGPCLLLVQLNYQWLVLSEVGAHGRTGGPPLLRNEGVWFVTCHPQWASYRVKLVEKIPHSEIAARFGREAAHRAREDFPALVVHAEPWSPLPAP